MSRDKDVRSRSVGTGRVWNTDLVQSRHEAGVVVEGRHDQSVVLLVDVQGGLHVHFGVLEETLT